MSFVDVLLCSSVLSRSLTAKVQMNTDEYRRMMSEGVLFLEFFETRQELIFGGEDLLAGTVVLPWDGESRIIVADAAFALRMVVVVALIGEDRMVFEHDKAVCKAARDIELGLVLAGQQNADPSSEGRRVFAKVDGDIVDTAADHAYEFGLRAFQLQMQPPKHTFAGAGLVALDEGTRDDLLVGFLMVGL